MNELTRVPSTTTDVSTERMHYRRGYGAYVIIITIMYFDFYYVTKMFNIVCLSFGT
jgi:hypothetical protein